MPWRHALGSPLSLLIVLAACGGSESAASSGSAGGGASTSASSGLGTGGAGSTSSVEASSSTSASSSSASTSSASSSDATSSSSSAGGGDVGGGDVGGAGGSAKAITVDGNQVLLDGARYVPRGVIFEGFLEPLKATKACIDGGHDTASSYCARHLASRDYYAGSGPFVGKDALSLGIADWKIDTVRFNLSQAALAPSSPSYDPAYIEEIAGLVAKARAKKLVVMLALFAGRNQNGPQFLLDMNPNEPIQTATTKAAANALAKRFGDDRGVILELFNEPFSPTNRKDGWAIYIDGGSPTAGKYAGQKFVGLNDMIKSIRGLGAKNAIIVQGLTATFVDYPGGLVDDAGLLVFAAHPFLSAGDDEEIDWYSRFGVIAKTTPFLLTAWNAQGKDDWCPLRGVKLATTFAQYLASEKIGLVGYAFDVNFTITKDFQQFGSQETKMGNACADNGHAGDIVKSLFAGTLPPLKNAQPKITAVDAPASVKVGADATFTVTASDPDGDPISFATKVGKQQSFRQREKSLVLSWKNAGGRDVVISVADNKGAEDTKTVHIDVTP